MTQYEKTGLTYVHIKFDLFLNQVSASQRPAHTWFLEIAFARKFGMSVYMHVCVRMCVHLQGYKLHSCDIEPVQPAEQVCCI